MEKLIEAVLPRLIGPYLRWSERLTLGEGYAQKELLASLGEIRPRTTQEPVAVAMVGFVGSGKSSVARALAEHIGGTVVEADAIRVALRQQGERYDHARVIAENAALKVLEEGGNIILDSDFISTLKRASIREKMRRAGARLVFVRTHCDIDIISGRIMTASYRDTPVDFYGGAASRWHGSEQEKGAAVKIREMWRRTPQHYSWRNKTGGEWILRKLPFDVLAEIDTSGAQWMHAVAECSKKL